MKITIKDVANIAGVSPSTVSRVISDSPRISDETKSVVRAAMQELGYHPNAIARSLVNKFTNTIGIVMPQSTQKAILNPFFPEALSGMSEAAHKNNYCMIISTGTTEIEQLESIKNIIMGGRVDGVILMYSSVENTILDTVRELNIPALIIGKPINSEGILYVDNDNVGVAYRVTESLINNGHKRIAMMCGNLDLVVSIDRLDGYRNALQNSGIAFDRKYVTQSEFSKEAGYINMKKMLNCPLRPTAVVVTDDIMAFGALDAIKELGLKIPEEIELVSFNNVPYTEFTSPKITSVDIDAYGIGYESANLLIQYIKGKNETEKVIVPSNIICRESSKNINI